MDHACCVYLIEDDETVARSLSALLRIHGYQALRFDTADAFLACVDDLPPGCILMDYSLPGLDGLAATRALRDAGYKWPIILMTGYLAADIAAEAERSGVRSIIEKPFSVEALVQELTLSEGACPRGTRRGQRANSHHSCASAALDGQKQCHPGLRGR